MQVQDTTDILISWNPVSQDTTGSPVAIDHYEVYRDTLSYFEITAMIPIGVSSGTKFVDIGSAGEPSSNHFYKIVTVSSEGVESVPSTTVGEFDHLLP